MGINTGILCPENYILLGNSDTQKAYADVIISEMKVWFGCQNELIIHPLDDRL